MLLFYIKLKYYLYIAVAIHNFRTLMYQ